MKRLVVLVISLAILGLIYWAIDPQALIAVFRNCDRTWLAISLGMVVPLTLLTALRFQILIPHASVGFGECNRLILASSTLNLLLPSKMGDLAKAYFMSDRGHLDAATGLSLVVFERACDMLSLLVWCVFGLMLYPQKDWLFWLMTVCVVAGLLLLLLLIGSKSFAQRFFKLAQAIVNRPQFGRRFSEKMAYQIAKLNHAWGNMHQYFWSDRRQLAIIGGLSLLIWFLHLLQIWFFIFALNASVPFLANLALAPLSILVGLLPLTFAGVGTRDAAIIAFYRPYLNLPTAAALGILCTSRYLMPAIAGLPFLSHYLSLVRRSSYPSQR